jgi:hypothetical protein
MEAALLLLPPFTNLMERLIDTCAEPARVEENRRNWKGVKAITTSLLKIILPFPIRNYSLPLSQEC